MSIKKSLIWTAFGQVALFSSQMASQIIVARELPPYLVGISAIAFSITDLINLMQIFGLRNFLIREVDIPIYRLKTAFSINVVMALVTSSVIVGLAYWGAKAYNEPGVGRVLHVTAFIPLIMCFELVPSALLQRNMKFGYLAFASSAKAIVTAGTTISLVLLGMSYMSIGYGALAGALVGAALTVILGRHSMHWGFGFRDWRILAKFGLHMVGVNGVSTISARLAELIIGRFLGLADLALYSRASALNNLLWTNIHSVFTRVVFSAMAEEHRVTGSIRVIYIKTLNMVTAILWPAFAGLAILSGPTIYMMYGDKWVAAAPVLSLFAVSAIGLTSITMTWEVFVICKKTGEQVRLESLRSMFTLAVTLLGAMLGVVGAAFGRIGDAVISNILYRRPLANYTETSTSEIMGIYFKNLVVTIAAVLPAFVLMALNSWDPKIDFGLVICAVALGVICWTLAVQIFNPILYAELRDFVRAVRRRGNSISL